MTIKQRAVKTEQKQQRRRDILNSAKDLILTHPYDKVNMTTVANRIGLTKGTVYLYFSTKEALFIGLFSDELNSVCDDLEEKLTGLYPSPDIEDFVTRVGQTVRSYPIFIRLASILHSVLEQNIDYETAFNFKSLLLKRILKLGQLLESCFPFLGPYEGAQIFLRIHEMIIGCSHITNYGPEVKKILEQPGFEILKVDFLTEFLDHLTLLMIGIQHRQGGSHE